MNFYLNKYGFQEPVINTAPHPELEIAVIIPCFNEPSIIPTLTALLNCSGFSAAIEVIVVVNSGEKQDEQIKKQNRTVYNEGCKWAELNSQTNFQFHFILEENLPKKHAGVGLARKIGMDEAVARFHNLNQDGIIVCFDADSLCDTNYLAEIEQHFNRFPKSPGCSIHFEHPLQGNEFSAMIYQGIINYELHLRYYNQGLKFAGLPYAFHTVGSSMAVRSSAYQKQGGMNKRKAGEDFYFIHKIIELGDFTELKSTRVIPSPRISDRVPFGTGKAIGDWVDQSENDYLTYAFKSFKLLKTFVSNIPKLRTANFNVIASDIPTSQHQLIAHFLIEQNFQKSLDEIRINSKTEAAFIKRFYRWFDAFKVLKFMHFMRDNGLPKLPVEMETLKLLSTMRIEQCPKEGLAQLTLLRQIERT